MFARCVTISAVILSIMAVPCAAVETSTPDCWRADEYAAARVGDLQAALMVLALKCQDTTPATLAAYNKFMADRRDVVVKDRYLIQAHFVRRLGPSDGLKASADYDTRIGNQSSAPVVDVAQCEKAGAHARLAAVAAEGDLPVLAGLVAVASPLPECPAVVAAAKPVAMVIPVWAKPAAAPVAPEEPAVAAVAPLPASTSVPPAAVPSQADAVKALQAAVAALGQVAASLQPVATGTGAAPASVPAAPSGGED